MTILLIVIAAIVLAVVYQRLSKKGNATINQIKKYTDRPIRVRMHPLRQEQQLEILQKFDVENYNTLKYCFVPVFNQ